MSVDDVISFITTGPINTFLFLLQFQHLGILRGHFFNVIRGLSLPENQSERYVELETTGSG